MPDASEIAGKLMADLTRNNPALVRPGAALKALRLERGWSLAEVSRRTGLPVSSLSKVENEKMELTLDRLLRIGIALEADVAGLFAPAKTKTANTSSGGRRTITRAAEGPVVDTPIGAYRYLAYDLLNKHAVPMTIDVTARSLEEFGEFNSHPGEEFLYVIEGELDLYSETYSPANLRQGDSMYFDSTMGHAYVAAGNGPCRILSICIVPEAELITFMESKRHTKDGQLPSPVKAAPAGRPALDRE